MTTAEREKPGRQKRAGDDRERGEGGEDRKTEREKERKMVDGGDAEWNLSPLLQVFLFHSDGGGQSH